MGLAAGRDSLVQTRALPNLQLPCEFISPNILFTQVEIFKAHAAMEGFGSPLLGAAYLGPFSYNQLRRTINFCTRFTGWQFRSLAGVIRVFQETPICQQLPAVHLAGLSPPSTSTWTLRGRREHSMYTCMDICAHPLHLFYTNIISPAFAKYTLLKNDVYF